MRNNNEQSGFVAILTVIFFTLLMSVISVGFLRLMVQEQQQALQDDLSKSAYQSAQAGTEDAKRAMLYCDSLSGLAKATCDNALYHPTCPGFNSDAVAGGTTFNAIGIQPASAADGSTGTGVGESGAAQGYSCVIIKPNTAEIKGDLFVNRTTDATFIELKGTAPFSTVRIRWHVIKADTPPYIPAAGSFSAGNPRAADWKDPTGSALAPAMLRVSTVTLPASGSFSQAQILSKGYFFYPSETPAVASVPDGGTIHRYETKCVEVQGAVADYGAYACTADIKFGGASQPGNRYLVLQTMYNNTQYSVSIHNPISPATPTLANAIPFNGVQPVIDSTGYANGVFRRIQTRVRLGGESFATNTALDVGLGICKDFRVGAAASGFQDNCF